ncbi:MAG: exodeoxyribonuclease V subunit gamma [Gammaproteobacteria bacterium]|nr:exodeoxyribonuclease V subunit gamma [Gammaproteobacteria bacterium]
MTRPLRLEFSGALHHLTARGSARGDIFRDDEDRHLFLERLGKEISQQGWRCTAYCLLQEYSREQGQLRAGAVPLYRAQSDACAKG